MAAFRTFLCTSLCMVHRLAPRSSAASWTLRNSLVLRFRCGCTVCRLCKVCGFASFAVLICWVSACWIFSSFFRNLYARFAHLSPQYLVVVVCATNACPQSWQCFGIWILVFILVPDGAVCSCVVLHGAETRHFEFIMLLGNKFVAWATSGQQIYTKKHYRATNKRRILLFNWYKDKRLENKRRVTICRYKT